MPPMTLSSFPWVGESAPEAYNSPNVQERNVIESCGRMLKTRVKGRVEEVEEGVKSGG